eukprot:1159972-Pelagomonas_calceolata.AAC.9
MFCSGRLQPPQACVNTNAVSFGVVPNLSFFMTPACLTPALNILLHSILATGIMLAYLLACLDLGLSELKLLLLLPMPSAPLIPQTDTKEAAKLHVSSRHIKQVLTRAGG